MIENLFVRFYRASCLLSGGFRLAYWFWCVLLFVEHTIFIFITLIIFNIIHWRKADFPTLVPWLRQPKYSCAVENSARLRTYVSRDGCKVSCFHLHVFVRVNFFASIKRLPTTRQTQTHTIQLCERKAHRTCYPPPDFTRHKLPGLLFAIFCVLHLENCDFVFNFSPCVIQICVCRWCSVLTRPSSARISLYSVICSASICWFKRFVWHSRAHANARQMLTTHFHAKRRANAKFVVRPHRIRPQPSIYCRFKRFPPLATQPNAAVFQSDRKHHNRPHAARRRE